MLGEIMNAVLKECRAMLTDTGGTVLLKTDYAPDKISTYTMPLVLVHLVNATESLQYPGGLTREDWQFAMNSYNFEPDMTVDDETDYSTGLLNVIDDVRRHFSNSAQFTTSEMQSILNQFGFRFTMSGTTEADVIEESGLVMGYKIVFDSVAFDEETTELIPSVSVLEHAVQVNNPPFYPGD